MAARKKTGSRSPIPNPRFYMPPEWARQKRIWIAWPHQKADWPGKFGPIPWVFAEIIRTIAKTQRVGVVVKDAAARNDARAILGRAHVKLKQIDFLITPTDRGWMRDCGPIWVSAGKKHIALDWQFSAWAKYPNWKKDNAVPRAVAAFTKHQRVVPTHKAHPVVLEGGGVEVDGAGTILVTKEWLLSDTQVRNPGFTRVDYEQIFEKYLGCSNTIWLNKGIVGDDTHGHIDDLARFVAPGVVVTVVAHDKRDPNHALLKENLTILKRATDAQGKKLKVLTLPMPSAVMFDGERLPASYANFLICNKVVLVPVFGVTEDREALNTLANAFPTREVIGIYARDLVWGLGTIHCLTQQEPA